MMASNSLEALFCGGEGNNDQYGNEASKVVTSSYTTMTTQLVRHNKKHPSSSFITRTKKQKT